MLIADVNILVYAFREDAPDHTAYKAWLDSTIAGKEPVGVSELVLSGFLRIVTHPRIFRPPTPLKNALEFVEAFRANPSAIRVAPGERHWDIFVALCRTGGAKGNLIPDAYLAALAIESGSEWLTTDREYARFPGLRWRHPLDETLVRSRQLTDRKRPPGRGPGPAERSRVPPLNRSPYS